MTGTRSRPASSATNRVYRATAKPPIQIHRLWQEDVGGTVPSLSGLTCEPRRGPLAPCPSEVRHATETALRLRIRRDPIHQQAIIEGVALCLSRTNGPTIRETGLDTTRRGTTTWVALAALRVASILIGGVVAFALGTSSRLKGRASASQLR